jgi:hypothetical protein
MTTTASIAELQRAGILLDAREAVAIAQQLIQALRQSSPGGIEPPYGPPTASNVVLNADGSVACAACGTTPAISEMAIFLDSLIPAGAPRVPGGLRYIIARGLLEVDVVPFDSIDEFSEALKRHERGERHEIVRRLLTRAEAACAAAFVRSGDRRRSLATATDLRRALRDADARLYEQQGTSWTSNAPPPRARPATAPAIAACIGSGLLLIVAGEFMYGREPAAAAEPARITAAPAAFVKAEPAAIQVSAKETLESATETAPVPARRSRTSTARRGAGVQFDSRGPEPTRPVPRVWPEPRERSDRPTAKPAARAPATIGKVRAERPGVMDRLRLRWLRDVFATKSEAL